MRPPGFKCSIQHGGPWTEHANKDAASRRLRWKWSDRHKKKEVATKTNEAAKGGPELKANARNPESPAVNGCFASHLLPNLAKA